MNRFLYSRIFLAGITFLILIITSYFGLRFKGYRLENNVTWLKNEPGIRFKRFGIAYSKLNDLKKKISLNRFTIEMLICPETSETHGFNIIMSISNGKDSDQLIIGQWKSYVVIMNGDDYSNKRKIKRISADIFKRPYTEMMLTVTAGEKGTDLFINGELINSRPDLILNIPTDETSVLTLGNSIYGNGSWSGNLYGFTLYDHQLTYEKVKEHYTTWEKMKAFSGFGEEAPLLLYDFSNKNRREADTSVKEMPILNIPVYFPILKKQILSAPWKGISFNINSITDITINLLGFIPLGFILYVLFTNFFSISQKKIMFFSALLCFLMSLFIEILQAWIPSRSSQSLDLILNTAGGYIGGILSKAVSNKMGKTN